MKNIFLLLIACCALQLVQAQTKTASCCMPNATETFAINGSNPAFVRLHDEPLPFTYTSAKGKDIHYKTPDGKEAHAWEIKASQPTDYYLFVVHEWWGLNDYIKQESERLSDELGINVIALDIYDNQVAATREDAAKYMQAVTTERGRAIVQGAFTYVGKQAKIFTIGWCFGGGWSLQTAIEGGDRVAGCIMFYGQPEKTVERLEMLKCDVMGFFAEKDGYITPAVVEEFKANMDKAGKKLTYYQYDAEHGFANPSNPKFDKEATADAYKKAYEFIKARIK